MYEDIQRTRIACVNRAERGGVDPEMFAELLAGLELQERAAAKILLRWYRATVPAPIRAWQQETPGLGEHSIARLLGLLGHPRQAQPWRWEGTGKNRQLVPDPPYERSISQLWSYCAVGDPTRRRRRDMSAEEATAAGSPRLRTVLFIISEALVRNLAGPYRRVYEHARETYAGREDWPPLRQHRAAMRLVAKEVLRDLWTAAGP